MSSTPIATVARGCAWAKTNNTAAMTTFTAGPARMREHFHRDLRGKIIGDLAKDFSRHALEDIASLIADP